MEKILIIYDGASLEADLVGWLSSEVGYTVETLELPDDLEPILKVGPDVVLIQYDWGQARNALSLLNLIKIKAPQLATIVFDRSNPDGRLKGELTRKVKRFLAREFIFDSLGPRFESHLLHAIGDVLNERMAIQLAQHATEGRGVR